MKSKELFDWIKTEAVDLHKTFNASASEQELKDLEFLIGKELPDQFKELYQLHNGQSSDEYGFIEWYWLPVKKIVRLWTDLRSMYEAGDFSGISSTVDSAAIESVYWTPGWIPIEQGGSDYICLDLSPTKNGVVGQIIRLWNDTGERELVATSLSEWINTVVDGLNSSEMAYSEELRALTSDL